MIDYLQALELTKKMQLINELNYKIETINGELQTIDRHDNFNIKYYNIMKDYKTKLFDFRQELTTDIDIELVNIKNILFKDIKN